MKPLIEEENTTTDDSAVGFLAISSAIRHQTLLAPIMLDNCSRILSYGSAIAQIIQNKTQTLDRYVHICIIVGHNNKISTNLHFAFLCIKILALRVSLIRHAQATCLLSYVLRYINT